jgi:pyruvate formate lyase activating enzyme
VQGYIHSFESFGTVDGPGIRFVVFMQGCPLRCLYCHNPDTWQGGGTPYEAADVAKKILRYKNYFAGGGGVTISGGEPLLQIEFVTELMSILKQNGVHTAVDTSGYTFDKNDSESVLKHEKLMQVCDLVLLDIKHADDETHRKITGKSNQNTLNFAKFLSEKAKPTWIRHVLVPSLTDEDAALKRLREIVAELKTVEKVEVLPYHSLGENKYEKLGIAYPLKGTQPPDKERVENAKRILRGESV